MTDLNPAIQALIDQVAAGIRDALGPLTPNTVIALSVVVQKYTAMLTVLWHSPQYDKAQSLHYLGLLNAAMVDALKASVA